MSKISAVAVPSMGTNFNGEESTVKINVDAFALQALSGKNLYRNLIRAIVRELSCNALDSHVLAGKEDVPFSVHLPTRMEPFFSVRDYGIGLDDAGVRDVYLTYFGSTKRSCEKTIGAWGLGSKSPLGYTENFTINAIKDGVKRMYVVFKNSEGMPAVKMMAQNETAECNGVEVVMPVINEDDMEKFSDEAKSIFTWFHVKPTLNVALEVNQIDWAHENLTRRVGIKTSGRSVVVHGNIEYPIDHYQIGDVDGIDVRDVLRDCRLVLKADLGTIDYSMSREELSYNDKTINTIKDMMAELRDELPNLATRLMTGLSRWDAYHTALKLVKNDLFYGVRKQIEALSPIHVELQADHDYAWFTANYTKFYKKARCKHHKSASGHTFHILPEDESVFWINDLGKTTGLKKLISYNCSDVSGDIVVFHDEKIKQDIVDKFGGEMTFKYLSEMKMPPKEAREKADKKDCWIRWYNGSDGKFTFNTQPIEKMLDKQEVMYYIKLKAYKPCEIDSAYIDTLRDYVKANNHHLCGVNVKAHDLLQETDHIDLVEAAREKLEDEIANFKVDDYVIGIDSDIVKALAAFDGVEDLSVIRAAINIKSGKNYSSLYRVAKALNVDISDIVNQYDERQLEVNNRVKELKKKYPLVMKIAAKEYYGIDNDTMNELRLYVSAKASVGG